MLVRIALIAAVFASLLTIPPALLAQKGEKGKGRPPGKRITEWEAADVTFADNAGDAIQSDGFGTYETFVDGFEAYSEYMRTEFVGGNREFALNLGIHLSGDASIDPSGPIGAVDMSHTVQNYTIYDLDESFPAPGTTLVSNPDHPQSIGFIFIAADGAEYALGGVDDTGLISLTAHDLDGDGNVDARSISVSPTLVWTLSVKTTETVTVTVGHGKNQEEVTEERVTSVFVAEYTGMPLDMWLDLLGFRVLQFSLR